MNYPQQPGWHGGWGPNAAQGQPGPQGQWASQPGYGQYPPSGQPPHHPPKRRKRLWLWLAPALVIVLAAAVTIPLVLTSEGEAQSPNRDNAVQAPPAPKKWEVIEQREAFEKSLNAWSVDDLVVHGTLSKIRAYAVADGSEQWTVEPPDPQGIFCGASTQVVDGRVAVAYTNEKREEHGCVNAALLDVRSGKVLWDGEFGAKRGSFDDFPSGAMIEIVGDTVVVGADEHLSGVDAGSGKVKWVELVRFNGQDEGCKAYDLLPSEGSVVITVQCTGIDAPGVSYQRIDVATGQVAHTRHYTSGNFETEFRNPQLVAVDPILTLYSERDERYLTRLDENFEGISNIEVMGPSPAPSDIYMSDRGFGAGVDQHLHRPVLVSGEVLYVVSVPFHDVDTNQLVAFDTKTGKPLWQTTVPDTKVYEPVAVDGNELIAVAATPTGDPGDHDEKLQVLRVSTKDGSVVRTQTARPSLNEALSTWASPDDYDYLWHDSHLYGVLGDAAQRSDEQPTVFSLGV